MSWKAWGYYSIAIVVTSLACWLWLFVLGNVRMSSSGASAISDSSAVVSVADAAVPPAVAPPAPKHLQQACAAGVKWFYDEDRRRWFKPLDPSTGRPLPCDLGTVRSENDREGLIVRHPKGWRPDNI